MLASLACLVASLAAPRLAWADKSAPKKGADKKTAPASTAAPAAEPAAAPATTDDTTKDDANAKKDDADAKKDGDKTDGDKKPTAEPPHEEWDPTNVDEVPSQRYLFIGLRYRGDIVPKFMMNLFVDEGATIYSNTIGVEFELRKDAFSLIPALSFTEYGTGDILFKEKNKPDIAGNYSLVNSSMKSLYATADLLWSTKISKNVDFEYGAGFGLGIIFGDLETNWVQDQGPTGGGSLVGANGHHYAACATEGQGGAGSGCNKADHQNADVAKVGGYTESSWFNGGSKPSIFPWISVPQIGLRFKPIKQFVGRLGLGFALTGFWFGLSGSYGLEQKPKP